MLSTDTLCRCRTSPQFGFSTVVHAKGGQERKKKRCKSRAPRPVRHCRRWTRHKSHSKQAHICIDLSDGTRTGGEPPAIQRSPPTRLGPPEKTKGTAHGDTPQVTFSLLTDAHLLVSVKRKFVVSVHSARSAISYDFYCLSDWQSRRRVFPSSTSRWPNGKKTWPKSVGKNFATDELTGTIRTRGNELEEWSLTRKRRRRCMRARSRRVQCSRKSTRWSAC